MFDILSHLYRHPVTSMNIDNEQLLDRAYLMVVAQQYEEAMTIYNRVIEVNSNCDEAYILRGELYQKLGQTGKAFEDVRKAISIDPDYDAAYLTLALLYQSQGELEQAIMACQQAISLNEKNNEAIKTVAQLSEMLADKQLAAHLPEKAAENYKRAIKYDENNIHIQYKYAFTMSRMGNFDLAIKLSEEILEKDANNVAAKSLLVSIYEKTGEHEKGWGIISALSHEYPANPFVNITYGKYALRNKQQTIAIKKLQHVLKQSEINIDDRLSLHMLLGKLYDSVFDYKNAFSNFVEANNLKYNDYDVKDFEDQVSNIISCLSEKNYSKLASSSIDSSECIFILGMPRSGTSLIEQIVSSHSQVYGGGELQYVPQLANKLQTMTRIQYPQLMNNITADELDNHANQLLASIKTLSPESHRITDKLPHNFLLIGLIHKLLPNAKIINCVRNPIDTCLSCYFQHFGGYHPYAYNLTHLGKYYRQYMLLMRHWHDELKIPILDVQYENLVQDTKNEVKKILDYLELDWEDTCLEFYAKKRAVNTASYTQVNKKIYTDSMNRWLNYKPYIDELITSLQ